MNPIGGHEIALRARKNEADPKRNPLGEGGVLNTETIPGQRSWAIADRALAPAFNRKGFASLALTGGGPKQQRLVPACSFFFWAGCYPEGGEASRPRPSGAEVG